MCGEMEQVPPQMELLEKYPEILMWKLYLGWLQPFMAALII